MCCLSCLFYSHSGTSWHHYTFLEVCSGHERIEWYEMRVVLNEGHTGARVRLPPGLEVGVGAQRPKLTGSQSKIRR